MEANPTLALAKELININSITPFDNGCQTILMNRLSQLGFAITTLPAGPVQNLWARHGDANPLFVFSAHTDTTSPGSLDQWASDPFKAEQRNGQLFGRGAANMKGALAAMLIACEKFLAKYPNHKGSIGFMVTSDEEGDATEGTIKIVDYLKKQNINIDWCLVGEATSNQQLGDVIKIGRRGSLHGELKVMGKQGHIALPQLADNPIHRSFTVLDELTRVKWDQGDEHFSPTTLQIYQIKADTGASNIIPGSLHASFNFRYGPTSNPDSLKQQVEKILNDHQFKYDIHWRHLSVPFLTKPNKLFSTCVETVKDICHITPLANTDGGTSDGRFIATTGCEVIELGAVNKTMNQINENIAITDLEKLTQIYQRILIKLLT